MDDNKARKRKESGLPVPYGNPKRACITDRSVSTDDEWRFRIKVLSSNAALGDEVLQEAVEGLARMCFPDGILQELGVDVVTADMEQNDASEQSIEKMKVTFETCLLNRLITLIAPFLNTPSKLGKSLATLKTMAGDIHKNTSADDVIVIDQPNDFDGLGDPQQDVREALGISSALKTNTGKGKKIKEEKQTMSVKQDDSTSALQNEDTTHSKGLTSKKKISSNWRWDVDPTQIDIDNLSKFFKHTSDLFAFHALPIVQQELGKTSKKAIRERIQASFTNLSTQQLEAWASSFEKLKAGEMEMLKRNSSGDVAQNQNGTQGPPAVTAKVEQRSEDVMNLSFPSGVAEQGGSSDRVHALTAPSSSGGPLQQIARPLLVETPLVDLFLRTGPKSERALDKIMQTLESRVSTTSIPLLSSSGKTTIQNVEQLQHAISELFSPRVRLRDIEHHLEDLLTPWVLANPSGFPELHNHPFFFIHIMPNTMPLTRLVHPKMCLARERPPATKRRIIGAIRYRGVRGFFRESTFDQLVSLGMEKFRQQLDLFLNQPGMANAERVRGIERLLRGLAFSHRDKFPELKDSRLVREWETMTGLKW